MAAPLRVVDTSAWIEWLTGSALGKKLAKELPDKTQCIVPTIVQLELSATANAIVYATARQQGAELLTCDAHFESLSDVVFLPKPG